MLDKQLKGNMAPTKELSIEIMERLVKLIQQAIHSEGCIRFPTKESFYSGRKHARIKTPIWPSAVNDDFEQ